jgi:hypothetical protein
LERPVTEETSTGRQQQQGLQGQNSSSKSTTTAGPPQQKTQLEHQGTPAIAGTLRPVEAPLAEGTLTSVETLAIAVMPKTQQGRHSRNFKNIASRKNYSNRG